MNSILTQAAARLADGDGAGAEPLLRRALTETEEPNVVRLHLAAALQAQQKTDAAVFQFARALQDAQQQGQWLDAATTPPELRLVVEGAVRFVRDHRMDSFARLLEPLAARFGSNSLRRVETALGIYFGALPSQVRDPRQRPSFLEFPGLPPQPYFDRAMFPWIDELEASTGAIRSELQQLLASDAGSAERVFDNEALEAENLRGSERPPSWTGYYFYRHGEKRAASCDACPATSAALDNLPLTHVRDHGPEVLFSLFTPGTHLLPHSGVTNARSVGHLPLLVPQADCALVVGGIEHRWQEGRVVVFDDTYEHEAWNRSDALRVVLIFDIWNPYLTDVERAALSELIAVMGDFRHGVETA